MRTNKTERMAYNFTKMAAYIPNAAWNYEFMEAAKDAGLACIDYRSLCDDAEQDYVFVPQKVWDEVKRNAERYLKYGIGDPSEDFGREARHWYRMAQLYR